MATTIRRPMRCAACAALLFALGLGAHAQPPTNDALEVTIRLLPENAVGPEDITRRIELPPAVAAAAREERPADGLPPAAENGRGAGLDIAAEARERGREFGQEVAEQARENRENAGRPDDAGPPIDVPGPPDTPGPPDAPGPPDTPGPPEGVPGPPVTPPGPP
jgi:hypothetical protein